MSCIIQPSVAADRVARPALPQAASSDGHDEAGDDVAGALRGREGVAEGTGARVLVEEQVRDRRSAGR